MTRLILLLLCTLAGSVSAQSPGNPIQGDRAWGYLNAMCKLGPRPAASQAMREQQKLIALHLRPLADEVKAQSFMVPNPQGGPKVRITNLIARWNPTAAERLLLCAHYDTRPFPDRDPNPQARRAGRFVGANDGASGSAVLMELAHHAQQFRGPLGVDFVFFDAEELVYNDRRDPYFLGSTGFARQYKAGTHLGGRYRWGLLLDMVGDADLQIYQERQSARWKDTRPLVKQIWAIAGQLGVSEFKPRTKHTVNDDHVPLHKIGGIPIIDLIDFDYVDAEGRNLWHTERDVPRYCSGASLAKVGWVVLEWMRQEQALASAER